MTEERSFAPGKAYYSKKLGAQVLCIDFCEVRWWALAQPSGFGLTLVSDAEVGLDTLDDMVRGVHYRSAIEVAERMVALGLDNTESKAV